MNRNLRRRVGVLCGLVTVLRPCAVVVGQPAQTAAGKGDLTWFREAKFGLFIHWGLYAVPAGQWKGEDYPWIGEWILTGGHWVFLRSLSRASRKPACTCRTPAHRQRFVFGRFA